MLPSTQNLDPREIRIAVIFPAAHEDVEEAYGASPEPGHASETDRSPQ